MPGCKIASIDKTPIGPCLASHSHEEPLEIRGSAQGPGAKACLTVSLWFLGIRASFCLQWLCNLRKLKYATCKPSGREFLVAVCTARRGLNTPLCFPRQVCDSYPTELYVPKSATAHIIVGSSKFRSRRRFPALSYYYKDNRVSLKACFCFSLCFSSFIISRPFSRGPLPVCGFEFLFKYVDVAMCAARPNTTCVKALSPVNVDLSCLFDSKERRLSTHLDLII